jgi:oligoribonuclease NrnB/cAMP/cGMP phosphodiesterase (DHH superfamily)
MIGVDYSDKLSDFNLIDGEEVYVVDFCFEPHADMLLLNNHCKLHWIDHHKTSIDWAEKTEFQATGGQYLEIGKGACELVWEYMEPLKYTPTFIRYLSKYDVWQIDKPNVLPFQYGMRFQENTMPDAEIWTELLDNSSEVPGIIKTGQTILKYETQQNAIYAKGMAYEAEFEGYRAIVMNKAYANSKAFDAVYDPKKHDIMILFGVKPGEIKYTLFCDKPEIDVSEIALKYGGRGHKGAAGFYSDRLLV